MISYLMNLITIPSELLLKIIYSAANFNDTDARNLSNISLVCKQIHCIMHNDQKNIIRQYTKITIIEPPIVRWDPNSGKPAPCFGIMPGRSETHMFNGKLHRDDDLPALIDGNLSEWRQHGLLHRDNDRPAIIKQGLQVWYKHGKVYRDDNQPAIINDGSSTQWYQNGKRPSEDNTDSRKKFKK